VPVSRVGSFLKYLDTSCY